MRDYESNDLEGAAHLADDDVFPEHPPATAEFREPGVPLSTLERVRLARVRRILLEGK